MFNERLNQAFNDYQMQHFEYSSDKKNGPTHNMNDEKVIKLSSSSFNDNDSAFYESNKHYHSAFNSKNPVNTVDMNLCQAIKYASFLILFF
jgi:hypothetical protein